MATKITGPTLPFILIIVSLKILQILGIAVVVTPENIVGRLELAHIPVLIAT